MLVSFEMKFGDCQLSILYIMVLSGGKLDSFDGG